MPGLPAGRRCPGRHQAGSAGAQSTAELLAIEADLSKRGIGLVVLSMGGEKLDTRNPTSKLMLTILAGVATWEREIMLERQREGIAKAKAEGKYKGRPPSIDAAQRAFSLIMAHRGSRAVVRQRDLFGRWANRWTVIRTSNLPGAARIKTRPLPRIPTGSTMCG